ncbi:MAG: hypothetical protein KBG28_03210 [Kofleriaceae bacterium]|nr:hypothetical protein [Kofleriaceae bacterium]MBP6838759.1 hypothetical protein [Kofleriaceae bacterium]MBP9202969.1 hypothetical protein [Kofleriaceae bacterium]
MSVALARAARTLGLGVVSVLLLATGVAAAEDGSLAQRMAFAERGQGLVVTTTIGRLFDSTAYDALDSGFPTTIVIRLWVYPKGKSSPVGFQLLQRRAVYDLWDEVYAVRLDGPGGRRTLRVKYRADALKLLTSIDALPIANLADLPIEAHHVLAVVAELNPVSQETLAEVRRWLSDGSGGLDRGGSFFGSFVSVFINPKVPAADRVLRLRSQPFYRPRR